MELQIELDTTSGFAVGEPLRGSVVAPDHTALDGTVVLRREEELEGQTTSTPQGRADLDDGRFRLIPEGPATYQSADTSVKWTLVATGTAGGRQFRAERPVRLAELPENRRIELTELSEDLDPFSENVAYALMGSVAVVAIAAGLWAFPNDSEILGTVLIFGGLAFGVWGGKSLLQRTHLADARARWDNDGEVPTLVLSIEPRRPVVLESFTMEVTCMQRTWERNRSSTGGANVAVTVPVQTEVYSADIPDTLPTGQTHELRLPVRLPTDLPSTFSVRPGRLDGFAIVWKATPSLVIGGTVDWDRDWELDVQPTVGTNAGTAHLSSTRAPK